VELAHSQTADGVYHVAAFEAILANLENSPFKMMNFTDVNNRVVVQSRRSTPQRSPVYKSPIQPNTLFSASKSAHPYDVNGKFILIDERLPADDGWDF